MGRCHERKGTEERSHPLHNDIFGIRLDALFDVRRIPHAVEISLGTNDTIHKFAEGTAFTTRRGAILASIY